MVIIQPNILFPTQFGENNIKELSVPESSCNEAERRVRLFARACSVGTFVSYKNYAFFSLERLWHFQFYEMIMWLVCIILMKATWFVI